MNPLTFDDLIPLDEFTIRRAEFFASHRRYLDRYRRVRLGPDVSLIFENRQTIWFKLQELFRVARLADRERVQRELDWYNVLLPRRGRLRASMIIDGDSHGVEATLRAWSDLRGSELCLLSGRERTEATILTCRPEDLSAGTAHMLEFEIIPSLRESLIDAHIPVGFEVSHGEYVRQCALSDSMRQSLVDDLALSDRDAA